MSLENYGDYQLIKKLASGGMASIFLARQKGVEGFEKLLVVKRILPHLAENDEFVTMFLDEARIAARLNHPNIVQIFNLGAQADTFFIAMEYIHGEDVRRVWKKSDAAGKPIPIPLVCRIVMDAAAGLDYAHKKVDNAGKPLGIVHRDISPQNILVTFEGGVKVVDFGIAKAADQATVTKSGVLKGKYSYMSPEQAAGQKIDHRSDIFALGVVLYELLTGARLFKRPNDIQTLNAVAECNVAPPSTVNARVPKDLDVIVLRALAKEPEDRYADASVMQASLEQWLLQNKLPSSAVHLASFMQEIYADRLKREAEEGRVLVEELDKSRNPEEPLKATSSRGPGQKSSGGVREGARATKAGQVEDPDVTRAERSSESRERKAPKQPSERERVTGRTETMASVTEVARRPARFPWVWAALFVVIGAGLGAWLVLRATSGGVVRLVTDPPGAQVTLDGALLADLATPCTLPKLPAGKHTLGLWKKGYEKLETEITVPGRGEVTLPPFRLPAAAAEKPRDAVAPKPPPEAPRAVSMTIKSSPPGAIAWVDGKKIGPTPLTMELLIGAQLPVKLELSGHKDLETSLTVPEAGGDQSFTLEKEKKKGDKAQQYGTVRFAVSPYATVKCDDLDLGDVPPADRKLPVGTYHCVLTNPDTNQRHSEQVKVEPNTTTKVQYKFAP